jgi:hypothetical protein
LSKIFDRSGYKSSPLPDELDFPRLIQMDCEKGGAIKGLFDKLKFNA